MLQLHGTIFVVLDERKCRSEFVFTHQFHFFSLSGFWLQVRVKGSQAWRLKNRYFVLQKSQLKYMSWGQPLSFFHDEKSVLPNEVSTESAVALECLQLALPCQLSATGRVS